MKSRQVNYWTATLVLALAALGGCTAPVKKDDATVVRERAVARWNLLIAHKAEQAYDYLSPGYRATQSREDYAKAKNATQLRWQSVQPSEEKCEAETCTVRVIVTAKVMLTQPQGHEVETQSPVTEHWLKDNGQWYFLPEDVRAPAATKQP